MDQDVRPGPVLVATLGSEPQVITAALDLLHAQRVLITKAVVVHTVAPGSAIARAVDVLQEASPELSSQGIRLELVPVTCGGKSGKGKSGRERFFSDVDTPEAGEAVFRALYRQIWQAKRTGAAVHLCIAGGRKTMAVYGMVAAQMLFDDRDHLWHLYSGGEFLASKRLHPLPGDDARLAEIPVLLRSYISPALTGLRGVEDALEAVERLRSLDLERRMEEARSFVFGTLTGAEERAVRLLVREGLSDQAIASRLSLSSRTVEQQLRSAYSKAAAHWEMEAVTRGQLIALLNLFYTLQPGEENRGNSA